MFKKTLLLAALAATITGAAYSSSDDGFEVGKVVAKNEMELKNNPAFIQINTEVVPDSNLRKTTPYWLKPGTKVVIQRSDGSYTYGYVSINGVAESNHSQYIVGLELGNDLKKIVPVGLIAEATSRDVMDDIKTGRIPIEISYNKDFFKRIGFVHKSWIKEKNKNQQDIINPDTIFYKEAIIIKPLSEKRVFDFPVVSETDLKPTQKGSSNKNAPDMTDGFEIGKVVAKNETELKNNPDFVLAINTSLILPDLREENKLYWLQPGTKVVVRRSNGSFNYGYVYIEGAATNSNVFKVGIQTGPDKSSRKEINIGTFGPKETKTKYGITRTYRSMTYDRSFYLQLGYVHKSWLKGKDADGFDTVNPDTISYKDAVTEKASSNKSAPDMEALD
jgi:hypothetical protein